MPSPIIPDGSPAVPAAKGLREEHLKNVVNATKVKGTLKADDAQETSPVLTGGLVASSSPVKVATPEEIAAYFSGNSI
ncbi:MAG: hypothetical protein ACOYJ2_04050 [Rickettsiales bacterium]